MELMRAIRELKIRWFTETDLSVADDPELLGLISDSGCYQILIGLESARPQGMEAADPVGWKKRQHSKYKSAIDRIQSHGISVNGCFILGWDHDTPESFAATRDFVRELRLAEVQVTLLTPFPNTELYRKLKAEGRLLADPIWDACTLFDATFHPKRMSVMELEAGFRAMMKDIYSAEAVAERKQVFKDCVRAKHGLRRELQQNTRRSSPQKHSAQA
jgi:radical SAM superfamily enzyme YgiQ (UPF0313 family)